MPQSQFSSRSPFARSHPAAVALLVLLTALSVRATPPAEEAANATAHGTSEAVAAPVTIDAGVAPVPATMVRAAAGEVDGGDLADHAADPALEHVDAAGYPHPVEYLTVEVDGTPVPLAFMDVSPTGPVNGRAILILHDRDDAGDAWSPTIGALAADGFRVLVPDQVGHGLSGRVATELPAEALAAQAAILLDSLGAPRVAVVGDGLGADVAVRLAGAHAGLVERMVLLPEGSTVTPDRAVLRDPVRGRRLPVLVVADGEVMRPQLLAFLGR